MKLITAIIKPFKLDDVKDALKDAGVAGHDRDRGAGVRPPGRAHRGVPGRGVQGRLRAEGEARGAVRRRRRRAAHRRDRRTRPAPARSATARSGSVAVEGVDPHPHQRTRYPMVRETRSPISCPCNEARNPFPDPSGFLASNRRRAAVAAVPRWTGDRERATSCPRWRGCSPTRPAWAAGSRSSCWRPRPGRSSAWCRPPTPRPAGARAPRSTRPLRGRRRRARAGHRPRRGRLRRRGAGPHRRAGGHVDPLRADLVRRGRHRPVRGR